METVSSRLKEARIKAGFKRAAHAVEKHRWAASTYFSHENGGRAPDRVLVDYARAFNVDYDWLKTGKNYAGIKQPVSLILEQTSTGSVVSERIHERLDALGLSGLQAERLSKNYRGLINQITAEKARMPAADRMDRLASVLQCDVGYLLGTQNILRNNQAQTVVNAKPSLAQIPLIGKAGAGAFVRVDDIADELEVVEGARHPKFPGARHFAVNVEGDSMNDLGNDSLFDGDIAFAVAWFDTGYAPRDGYIVVVEQKINGGHIKERTVKEIRIAGDGIELVPRSTNPKHKTLLIPFDKPPLDSFVENDKSPFVESDDGKEIEIVGLVYGANRIFSRRI